ncbi:alpha-1,3-mannosyl-glycoprotein 4-beta-N-acetylglucosaminyltransferase C-like [Mytilus trossulus]|uniref:alpha-1,3-mannosyl-glycoprotein 4-beta-N-acetylglucosaminyltransferase C-like n=1 Tax=Mytilus trossulus TaxID=6551 RepID=UPI003006E279
MRFWKKYKLYGLSLACCIIVLEFFIIKSKSGNQMVNSQVGFHFNTRELLKISGQQTNWRQQAQMVKTRSILPRYLTIGIPTVRRQKTSYFFETVDSLLNCTTKAKLSDIVIVIFLADFNSTWKQEMSTKIRNKYEYLLNNGDMHVIEAPRDFYPKLNNLEHTFNDSEERTKWRSKQNVDYAFLWLYSSDLSKFYMQIEDDVFTISGYLDAIKKFIAEQKNDWTCLEFSTMGFIGKVFHSNELEKLAKTVLMFYDKQPVDFLYIYFNHLNLQGGRIIRRPTIFRHVGYHSSLPGKTMNAADKYFDNFEKSLKGDNPTAKLLTTLKVSPDFPLDLAYSTDYGYFWSQSAPRVNDTVHILFDEPQSITKVIVETGSREHPNDKLEHARLEACLSVKVLGVNTIKCYNTLMLGSFKNGSITIDNMKSLTNFKITCLKIVVTKYQSWWLIIKEIAIFIKH